MPTNKSANMNLQEKTLNTAHSTKNKKAKRRLHPDDSWKENKACKPSDHFMFYGETQNLIEKAKKVCAMCEVSVPCLEYAITNQEVGVWGGTTDKERKKLLKKIAFDSRQ